MAASQHPRERRPGTTVHRAGDEVTLVGKESEPDVPSEGIPRGPLTQPTPLPERSSSASPRTGTRLEHHNGEVVLRGDESVEEVSEGVVVALSPPVPDGDDEPS